MRNCNKKATELILEFFESNFADRKIKRRGRGFLSSETLSPHDINYS